MRSRQLKVLAGDYYSSRFYQLLAQAGQVGMIRRISNGVCEVNKIKVNFYMKMKQLKLTAEEYLNQCVQVKTELFTVFTEILDEKMARVWTELLQGLGRCEVVMDELLRSDKPEQFNNSWGYWHVLQVGTDEEKRKLNDKLKRLPSSLRCFLTTMFAVSWLRSSNSPSRMCKPSSRESIPIS